MDEKLAAVIQRYRAHPEFLGIEITDLNQPGAVDDTLLHWAARTGAIDEIELLLSSGARVNAVGNLGNTPLHQAAMGGNSIWVQKLLQHGADQTLPNEFGQTLLELAELGGHLSDR
jgi:uncharacterized protein